MHTYIHTFRSSRTFLFLLVLGWRGIFVVVQNDFCIFFSQLTRLFRTGVRAVPLGYVCMYVCTYVRSKDWLYECMYICMYVSVVKINVYIHTICMYVCMCMRCMYVVKMYVCIMYVTVVKINVCMYVGMYVCIRVYNLSLLLSGFLRTVEQLQGDIALVCLLVVLFYNCV